MASTYHASHSRCIEVNMKHFKHVLGLLSRDMLMMHGHFLMVRNLDGAAQRASRPPAVNRMSGERRASGREPCAPGTACAH